MDLDEYQARALVHDRVPEGADRDDAAALMVPMLGLAGETGSLLKQYKKHLRDGEAHRLFKGRVAEELGDLLWYVSNVASKFGLELGAIAAGNLRKLETTARPATPAPAYDEGLPIGERLPRRLVVRLSEETDGDRPRVRMTVEGRQIGFTLGDNSYDPDGYRFHDVFHLAYAAVLGWSPNIRAFLERKRRSSALLDEVEDGGRARVIEEAVSALAFDYARDHDFLDGVEAVDEDLLRTIVSMTSRLEVADATPRDWERAIFAGFAVWRRVLEARGGIVSIDLDAGTIGFSAPS